MTLDFDRSASISAIECSDPDTASELELIDSLSELSDPLPELSDPPPELSDPRSELSQVAYLAVSVSIRRGKE